MVEHDTKQSVLSSLLKNVAEDTSPSGQRSPITTTTASNTDMQKEDEVINLGENFDFDGFEVVRREFFAHTHEPSVTFNNCKFYVNTACLQKFPDTTSVQVLINQATKIMALMPCPDGAKDSFIWCGESKGKRKPKQTTCKMFFIKIFDLMNWNPDYRYKLLGKLVQANGQTLLAFDLTATEVYQRTFSEGSKPKTSRTPIFPSEWKNQFGLPYAEHKQSMQINIFDGYAVYSIKDTNTQNNNSSETDTSLAVPSKVEP